MRLQLSTSRGHFGYQTFDGWVPVSPPDSLENGYPLNEEEAELQLANTILAAQRKLARDHDHRDSGEKFYGVALIKTAGGNYFTAANIHLPFSPLTRNCAEANAATCAANMEGEDMQITDVWFMGGRGNLTEGIEINPADTGRRNTPCGSCLDVIWDNRLQSIPGQVSHQTRIHMLPLNAGDKRLIPDDGHDPALLAPNQVMTRAIDMLLPHVTYLMDDPGDLKATIRHGWELLNDHATLHALSAITQADALIELNKMVAASPDEVIRAINSVMIDQLRDISHKSWDEAQQKHQLKSARVAIVRLDNGEFYLGASWKPVLPSMQEAEADAIESARKTRPLGHCITDIYIMAVDFQQMPEQLRQWGKNLGDEIVVAMPTGGMRDRIAKAGPNGHMVSDLLGYKLNKETGANVHMLLLNNKSDFNPWRHVVTLPINQLMPYRYISPKMDQARSSTSGTRQP